EGQPAQPREVDAATFDFTRIFSKTVAKTLEHATTLRTTKMKVIYPKSRRAKLTDMQLLNIAARSGDLVLIGSQHGDERFLRDSDVADLLHPLFSLLLLL
ncbi:MAG: hypothetical protein ACI9G1_000873, partial [Pirellulaceae bacterium]